ncbi:MAG: P-loop NTPase fold protein [Thermodesulfobacteriota bacterium]
MKAKNLRDALNILEPEKSLQTAEELRDYFVERPFSPIEELVILLNETADPHKILFTGHRGSGKSTELFKLATEVHEKFFTINYSIMSKLNLYDLKYVDVLFSLGLELVGEAINQKLPIKESVLNHFLNFTKEITKEVEVGVYKKAEVGGRLNFIVAKLSGKLSTEDRTRTIIREKISPRLSDLIENISFISKEMERVTQRKILFIIDHLDKVDLDTAKHLFFAHANALLAPPISIIYTFPTALRFDNDFIQISNYFPSTFVLPNIKTTKREGRTAEKKGLNLLQEILSKRVEKNLYSPNAMLKLAKYSGGIPRELIVLGRMACLEAMKSNKAVIDQEAVEQAARSKRRDYQVLLSQDQLKLLKKVRDSQKVDNDAAHRELLHNLSVLEYRDGDVWYDVHPIIEPLLSEIT